MVAEFKGATSGNVIDATKARAHLPGLEIEIVHRGRATPYLVCRCRFTQSSILRRAAALAPSRDPRNLTTSALSWAALSGK
jgi:hypothetical protein